MLQNINDLLQNKQNPKQKPYTPNSRQILLTAALWDLMSQLYSHKWISAQGHKLTERGEFTSNFIFWTQETEDLTDEQWNFGFEQLELKVIDEAKAGLESWPPTYAVFIGLCKAYRGKPKSVDKNSHAERSSKEVNLMNIAKIKAMLNQ